MRELKKQYSDINSRMPRHSCCEVRVMQLHDILLLRTSAILPEAISAGGLTPPLIQACFSPPIEVGVISQLIYKLFFTYLKWIS